MARGMVLLVRRIPRRHRGALSGRDWLDGNSYLFVPLGQSTLSGRLTSRKEWLYGHGQGQVV